VRRFEKWLQGWSVNQELLETYFEEINETGKSTKQLAAALKYRYVTFGKMQLHFQGLSEKSKHKQAHRYLERSERDQVDQMLVTNTKMRLACKLLYDLGARSQDLADLRFSSFIPTPDGSARVQWKPRKQAHANVMRMCRVPRETMLLVTEYR
jgi:hypothetical protein